MENRGADPVELREGESVVQLIPVKYYSGVILGAHDYVFRSERGTDGFGSTEARKCLEDLLCRHLAAAAADEAPASEDAPGQPAPSGDDYSIQIDREEDSQAVA